ncbi:ST3 beta-galactoside alpha-2,3-sialyltransferase 3a isoform X4 [Dicentrarchus labrax]|uniref:ST3 beta-galactoside alpha-2,3-sialyltransferase 3a isoform X4 n=1 Tax=Dicentrarchus labrax TaxID=13489 RepID=UPI0021F5E635|nr:ST3 beta-galactoside alpha-2,3-sialyltransferase 3a isoform X4 [Dicentrarchus labrax]
MRMKASRNLLLCLCSMLALGFLYYSSGRISLRGWGYKSLYDKQGFLLKLDGSLPLELVYKYGNLSEGACKPGFAAAKMTAIYPNMSCKTCIIVGNGGILANKSLGQKIDEFDVVVRLNEAPVKGFEKDVGSKTTMRITYPEGAIQKPEHYETHSLFVLSAFKAQDFKWLRHMVFNQRLRSTDGFWKSVARNVPRGPSDMRILNPYFIQTASFKLIGLPHNNGQMGRGNIPTLGAVAITMALYNCDEVAVAGFGYNMSTPRAPLHYYEKIRMSAMKESWTHNISKEKEFLVKLVKAGVIQDWTNGICGAGC